MRIAVPSVKCAKPFLGMIQRCADFLEQTLRQVIAPIATVVGRCIATTQSALHAPERESLQARKAIAKANNKRAGFRMAKAESIDGGRQQKPVEESSSG